MSEDEDTTELDIGERNWNKLERSMRLFGFREGAAEGKNLFLQQGFNRGYLSGFKLGEHVGMAKGIISCEAELQLSTDKNPELQEEILNNLSSQPCVLCLQEKDPKTSSSSPPFKSFEELDSIQQSHSSEIVESLRNSDLGTYFDKG